MESSGYTSSRGQAKNILNEHRHVYTCDIDSGLGEVVAMDFEAHAEDLEGVMNEKTMNTNCENCSREIPESEVQCCEICCIGDLDHECEDPGE